MAIDFLGVKFAICRIASFYTLRAAFFGNELPYWAQTWYNYWWHKYLEFYRGKIKKISLTIGNDTILCIFDENAVIYQI